MTQPDNSSNRIQEIFEELLQSAQSQKLSFCKELLYAFTIAGRSIWSDEESSDAEKVDAFKWLNELTHRVWNIIYELEQGVDNESIYRLHENIKFYADQSTLLNMQMAPAVFSAFDVFKTF